MYTIKTNTFELIHLYILLFISPSPPFGFKFFQKSIYSRFNSLAVSFNDSHVGREAGFQLKEKHLNRFSFNLFLAQNRFPPNVLSFISPEFVSHVRSLEIRAAVTVRNAYRADWEQALVCVFPTCSLKDTWRSQCISVYHSAPPPPSPSVNPVIQLGAGNWVPLSTQ